MADAWLSGTSVGISFDPASGMALVHIDTLASFIVGVAGFIATFGASRLAKRMGADVIARLKGRSAGRSEAQAREDTTATPFLVLTAPGFLSNPIE